LLIPEIILFFKGRAVLSRLEGRDDETVEAMEKQANKHLNAAGTLNGILMVLNFMIFGMSFDAADQPLLWVKLGLFLGIAVGTTVIGILMVKLVQKHDSRLKGDPATFRFQKDFIGSMDEAEKLKLFEAAYRTFQFARGAGLGIIVVTILLRMTGFAGGLPIFIASMSYLALIVPFSYFAAKSQA
jgi:hypothetical protein